MIKCSEITIVNSKKMFTQSRNIVKLTVTIGPIGLAILFRYSTIMSSGKCMVGLYAYSMCNVTAWFDSVSTEWPECYITKCLAIGCAASKLERH